MSKNQQKILIVGGGFAGVKAALELAKCNTCDVTLLSDHSHFRYYPGLYHTATGGRRTGSRIRLSNILQGSRVKFIKGTAAVLDREARNIKTSDAQTLPYDKLLLALGNVTNYFGIEGLREHSFGIKSTEEAEAFKQHLHKQFIENGCPDLNYVIVGGGPTGIELAGALPGYLQDIIKKHGAEDCKLNISLVEAAPKLLPRSPASVSRAVAKRLRSLGVKLYLGTTVKGQTADTLMINDTHIKSHTVIWTAGVANNPFFKANNFTMTDRGKVQVNDLLEAEPNIFVMGDNAGTLYSGMAQTALYDAEFVADNILRQIDDKPRLTYIPKKPITIIPVGPRWATLEWGKLIVNGWIAWLLHIWVDLVAFRELESWPKAGAQWIAQMGEEHSDCPHCSK